MGYNMIMGDKSLASKGGYNNCRAGSEATDLAAWASNLS